MLSRVLSTGWVGWGQPVVLRRRVVGGTTMGEERKTKGRGEVRERAVGKERAAARAMGNSPRLF